MPSARLEYHAPRTLAEAVALLREHGASARVLAGGTDVVPALKLGILGARHLVSLKRVAGARGIAVTPEGDLVIGALTTLHEVATSALVRTACPALATAAGQAGSPLLRNRGTLGGNVCLETRCWYYDQSATWRASRSSCLKTDGTQCHVNQKENRCVALFSADTPPVLLAEGARATLIGPDAERTIPVEALYTGDGLTPLAKDAAEILTALTVPRAPARSGTAYLKESIRESIDFPVLGVAAAVALEPGGMIAEARIAITGARSAPCRLPEVEAAVRGRPVPGPGDRHLARLAGRSVGPLFLSESAPYKRTLVGLMTVEALAAAAAQARSTR